MRYHDYWLDSRTAQYCGVLEALSVSLFSNEDSENETIYNRVYR